MKYPTTCPAPLMPLVSLEFPPKCLIPIPLGPVMKAPSPSTVRNPPTTCPASLIPYRSYQTPPDALRGVTVLALRSTRAGGFTPFLRTVWLSLNPASDAFPAVAVFAGYGIARYSRRYLCVPQPGFDTGD